MVQKSRHGQNFVTVRSIGRPNFQTRTDTVLEVLGPQRAQGFVPSGNNFGVEAFHSSGSEWRLFHGHLVEDTSERPNITSMIIRHVLPDFWASIVGGTSLSSEEAPLRNFRDVKISNFNDSFLGNEQISTLNVSVNNFKIMKSF